MHAVRLIRPLLELVRVHLEFLFHWRHVCGIFVEQDLG